ncbi:hypothetical protein [Scytonema sp. NUACC26]|uniref:hypothetical protein n=1 Tax=Scytonema sp. NUACC26 TaxID=3140176 RepID=UPI0034DBAB50
MKIKVHYKKLNYNNFRCGDVLEGSDNNQYVIFDVIACWVVLRELSEDERQKRQYIVGRVEI